MNTKDILLELRTKNGLTQSELAEKVFVTRQAVSRWETGAAVPGTETLKLLSKLFNVSVNTLLASPRKLICQCCGMPLEDEFIAKNKDGTFNEEYCKWCYSDGAFNYSDMNDLIEVCVKHMAGENFSLEQAREYLRQTFPSLGYWKDRANLSACGTAEELKRQLIEEINALNIKGMPKLPKLNALVGKYVNLEYPLPSGARAKFLNDEATYFGNQIEPEDGEGRCFGVLASEEFILICTYGAEGSAPELLLFKKR